MPLSIYEKTISRQGRCFAVIFLLSEKNMRILALGDVVGKAACEYLSKNLWNFRKEYNIDFAVVNGENSAEGNGISKQSAESLWSSGADVITTGNHIWKKNDIKGVLEDSENIIRPANYPNECPGNGYTVVDCNGYKILVMNVLGTVYTEPLACPFETVEKILQKTEGEYDISLLDIHAEATSEKIALGRYFDGKINAVFGTHTHVPTADEQIFEGGTGFVTDLGMCGGKRSVLGVKIEPIIKKLKNKMPSKFEFEQENIVCQGVVFDIAEGKSGFVTAKVERVTF